MINQSTLAACIASLFFLITCLKLPAQPGAHGCFRISGNITGMDTGRAYLFYKKADGQPVTEWVLIKNGSFTHEGLIEEPVLARLELFDSLSCFFYIDPGACMIFKGDVDRFSDNVLTGSKTNDDRIRKQQQFLRMKEEPEQLREHTELVLYSDTLFIMNNPDSYLSLYYLNFRLSDLSREFLVRAYSQLDDKLKNTSLGAKVSQRIHLRKIAADGTRVPDLPLLIDGKSSSLGMVAKSSQLIIIDFWASWCLPCRENVPFLKKVYADYNKKGLSILSISIDTDSGRWRTAMLEDGLEQWLNTIDSEDKGLQEAFGVDVIPVYFLLDKDLIIRGRYNGREKGKSEMKKGIQSFF